ncbi:MAG: multidrug DMT transporter permease [Planctomycetota bacterium]|nr:MAG: multidrug DMT transporter permease [Planctomycetota bacterium]
MVTVKLYPLAVVMCIVTMLCWGSWANTQKLASQEWPFQLFYWDYAIGVLLLSLVSALTLGSTGRGGRNFVADLKQAKWLAVRSALLGGVIFNLSNILLVAAIDIAGMAVAFPIGVGLALVLGVITNYIKLPKGNPVLLFLGVTGVVAAIVVDALAYSRLPSGVKTTTLGIVVSIAAGVLMGFFFRFVVASMATDFEKPEAGRLSPYTAVFFFSVGLFLSNFVWNSIVMVKPFVGERVALIDYFTKGNISLHLIGILGGVIWNVGMSFSIIASGRAGPSISYGLGQGATLVAALWGVFIWREFAEAPAGTNPLLALMFAFYIIGLGLIVWAGREIKPATVTEEG